MVRYSEREMIEAQQLAALKTAIYIMTLNGDGVNMHVLAAVIAAMMPDSKCRAFDSLSFIQDTLLNCTGKVYIFEEFNKEKGEKTLSEFKAFLKSYYPMPEFLNNMSDMDIILCWHQYKMWAINW